MKVRDLRRQAGLHVATVAGRLGISEAAVLAIEACPLTSTTVGALLMYAGGLGARVNWRCLTDDG